MTDVVLIVDDSLTVRMDLAEAFGAAGYRPVPCATAAEARSALLRHDVALVVLDVLLPDGDGVELLAEIRSAPATAKAPVLMLSTEAEVKDRVRGLQIGADEYVGKPYDASYIVARAAELLRRGRASVSADKITVLVIDDSLTYRMALQSALELEGYRVLTAASGEDGLRLAASARPNAIIVDGMLPGLDGAGVIRQARLDNALRGTPCLLLTASSDRGAELGALDAGADAFVRKEEDVGLILARLSAVLRASGARVANDAASLLGPKKVLAVDDSATYLQELSEALHGEGYDVVQARSGDEALELLALGPVDCILLDVVMPGLSGKETCERIKSVPGTRDIPLIMLTALEDRNAMIEGLAAGADDFISKSSELDVLRARVRAQLRRKQFEDEHRRIREELLKKEIEASEARAARAIVEARASLVEELARKNQELEAFSYSVSHDLRAPLRSIDGFSQVLLEDYADKLDDRARHYLNRVRVGAQRMAQLIDDLLGLSNIGRVELCRERMSLSAMARSVMAELEARAPERAVHVVIEEDLWIEADRGLIAILLENLLGNAWKFTAKRQQASIELGAMLRADETTYFVRDNGAGFNLAYADKLFSPFQRLHEATEFPGSGIGLATVYRVVDRHGGRIWADSAVEQGATFYFTLARTKSEGAR